MASRRELRVSLGSRLWPCGRSWFSAAVDGCATSPLSCKWWSVKDSCCFSDGGSRLDRLVSKPCGFRCRKPSALGSVDRWVFLGDAIGLATGGAAAGRAAAGRRAIGGTPKTGGATGRGACICEGRRRAEVSGLAAVGLDTGRPGWACGSRFRPCCDPCLDLGRLPWLAASASLFAVIFLTIALPIPCKRPPKTMTKTTMVSIQSPKSAWAIVAGSITASSQVIRSQDQHEPDRQPRLRQC